MKISVIDLGFNSLKLVTYDVKQDSSFTVFDQKSIPARLGEGLSQTGFLGTTPIQRALDGLRFFREVNEFNGVKHTIPVATSAVREAANSEEFLKKVLSETGFKFRVLSGREEALYSYTGAARSLGQSNILFFDIGGGSLEFVYSREYKVRKILSLPLGGLRLTQMYGDSGSSFKQKDWERMEDRVFELLPSAHELGLARETMLVGVGGNLRALARWDQELRDYPLNKLHNYSMKRQAVSLMTRELSKLSAREIADVGVIGKDRAETLAAGALVIEFIMRKLGFAKLTVSTHGLRDGVLSSFLDDPLAYHRGKMSKTLRRTLKPDWKQRFYPAIKNFAGMLQNLDLIDKKEAEILAYELRWIMAETSERPEAVFYSIMNDESFLSHRDQLIAAITLVESKRPRSAEWIYQKYKSMLKGKKSKDVIEKLAGVSRFLEIVLRTDSRIRFSVAERGAKIKLRVIPGTHHFPETLFGISVKELADEIDRFLEYSVKYRKPKLDKLPTLEGLE
ncbi:MAG: Ppx/GppA family phosphatase [Nitrososphaerota archaeon]|nr:Ppx/GppA family phosphatase [Nitrososphaerota archaeon]